MRRRRLLQVALGFSLVALASTSHARRRVRFGGQGISGSSAQPGIGGGGYRADAMTRAEIKGCLEQEKTINDSGDQLDREDEVLKKLQSSLDRYDKRAVDDFNSRASRFNGNGKVFNVKVDTFNKLCAGRTYYQSDMTSVMNELRMGIR